MQEWMKYVKRDSDEDRKAKIKQAAYTLMMNTLANLVAAFCIIGLWMVFQQVVASPIPFLIIFGGLTAIDIVRQIHVYFKSYKAMKAEAIRRMNMTPSERAIEDMMNFVKRAMVGEAISPLFRPSYSSKREPGTNMKHEFKDPSLNEPNLRVDKPEVDVRYDLYKPDNGDDAPKVDRIPRIEEEE